MKCKSCGSEYEKWIPAGLPENDLCLQCNETAWQGWEEEQAADIARVDEIEKAGHSRHCACRQVWGDGECECDLYKEGYDPYLWQKTP